MYDGETPEVGESAEYKPKPWEVGPMPASIFSPDKTRHFVSSGQFADLDYRIQFYDALRDHEVEYLIDRLYARLPEVDEPTEGDTSDAVSKPPMPEGYRVLNPWESGIRQLDWRVDEVERRARTQSWLTFTLACATVTVAVLEVARIVIG